MRLVVAVGGNALLERGDRPEAEIQEHHALSAVEALAPLAAEHELVVTHGNGPQVGLLAVESTRDPDLDHPYPLDVLGAQTQGMIGYFFLQAFENLLPDRRVASLICQTLVSADDPAFTEPAKFVGSVMDESEARAQAQRYGWTVRPDGPRWRRVVPSPEPHRIVELPTIRHLLEEGTVVVCAGGGGVPVVRGGDGRLTGWRRSSTRTSRRRSWPRTWTPTVWCSSPTCPPWSPDSAPTTPDHSAGSPSPGCGPSRSRPGRWDPRSRPPVGSPRPRVAPRIGRLADSAEVLAGRTGTEVVPG